MATKMKFLYRVGLTLALGTCFVLLFGLGGLWVGVNEPLPLLVVGDSKASGSPVGSPVGSPARIILHVDSGGPYPHPVSVSGPLRQVTATVGERIVLAVVVCGDRLDETLVMLKSAAALTDGHHLHFIIVAEDSLRPTFQTKLSSWPRSVLRRVTYQILPITFPLQDGDADEWRKLFKPCASQRLFLPTLLKDVDSLLYVDTDVLFLRPLNQLWNYFKRMNSSQMAAMTPEHEDFATGWYNRFARHPYYKPLGVNSGVMLMNLTRMRDFEWQSYVIPIYKEYKHRITWGDQDIINIIFHYHPDKLYIYPCDWNFRSDHCMYMSVCKQAEANGIGVLHGNRAVFHNDKQPAFKAVYRAFQQYNLTGNLRTELLIPMQKALLETTHTNCGKLHRIFVKALDKNIPAVAT